MTKSFSIILLSLLCFSLIFSSDKKNGLPDTVFVINSEPAGRPLRQGITLPATESMFQGDRELIALADKYQVKLTILCSPQMAQFILLDSVKIEEVREWQKNEHEIGLHHHSIGYRGTWDGYTDIPHERFAHRQEKYNGSISDMVKIIQKLAGPYPVQSACFSPEDFCWSSVVPYSIEGVFPKEGISQPKEKIFNGHSVVEIGHCYIMNSEHYVQMKDIYANATSEDIIGVITHDGNWVDDIQGARSIIEGWMKMLYEKDPKGEHNYTISGVMKKKGY